MRHTSVGLVLGVLTAIGWGASSRAQDTPDAADAAASESPLEDASPASPEDESTAPPPAPHGPAPDDAPSEPAPADAAVPPAPDVAEGARPMRIALYDPVTDGVAPRLAELVAQSTLVELRKLQRVSVIGMQEVRAMLDHEAQRQMAGCEADDSCLADIAGALGVDALVTLSLARVSDEHIFGMKRIDQRNARVIGSVSRRLVAEDGEEFLAAIGPAVAELFPDHPLRPGATRGVPDEVALRLNPPPLPTWALYATAGGAGALASAALLVGGVNLLVVGQFNGWMEQAAARPVDWRNVAPLLPLANVSAVGAWTLAAGAVVVGGGAAVMIPFVDWEGYGAADDEE